MLNYQINNETNYLAFLNEAIVGVQDLLTTFAFSNQALADFNIAFGSTYNREIALSLINQWQIGDFASFPQFEIRSFPEINGANGAYSVDTNKIYIAEEFLLANTGNLSAIVDLVLEEYGHFIDAQINSVDAKGNEGAIFSSLVQGETLNQKQIEQFQAENDIAVVNIDGQEIIIEQNNFPKLFQQHLDLTTVNPNNSINIYHGSNDLDIFDLKSFDWRRW
ncbi:MAG: hypothetical protein ACFBSE_16570 [Prochloraceae cyanobacterium]